VSSFTFDISLGREVEFHYRVNDSDPTNAALIVVVLAAAALEVDATLRTYATLSALLAAANDEVTNGSYARKTLTDADIGPASVDTGTHRTTLSFTTALQTFATIAAGDSWRKLLVCYDPDTTGGTDATVIPVTAYDMLINNAAVVPNGNDINADFSNGYCIAS
jgi:hypothetical protein